MRVCCVWVRVCCELRKQNVEGIEMYYKICFFLTSCVQMKWMKLCNHLEYNFGDMNLVFGS